MLILPLWETATGIHWVSGWVSSKTGMDTGAEKNIWLCQEINHNSPAIELAI
jgi:hypothetical protein